MYLFWLSCEENEDFYKTFELETQASEELGGHFIRNEC